LALFVGVDDEILEGVSVGATGWIAGLVNAFPEESVRLFALASEGRLQEAFAIYKWFLPLLRLDTMPKFIQFIKLAEERVGVGRAVVRPPRRELVGEELKTISALIDAAIASRPSWGASPCTLGDH
jgi:4-hydroxy-tetrahydrodipicolinate synthase